ncbi:hypothetical protein DH2020_020842 [Rehmannia glutinosa]|uniref:MI domain-containing protein n=1 Tax=Rehmannia glutinosa TaxID=99300 RepID=A0ABR0W9F9_REHGL
MARRHHTDSSSSSEDEKRGIRHRRSESPNEDRRKRRDTDRNSESEGSEKEVRHDRERRRERNDDESREKADRRREEKGNHGNRDSNMGRDSERDDRRWRNGRDDEIEENGKKSRKDDRGRERKSRHDEVDDEDYRKTERRRHRDYRGEDDKAGHNEIDRARDSLRDSGSDRRDRSRRSERGREDDEEEGEFRGREDHRNKYDDREDNRKERRRDRERERDRRHDENGDRDKRRSKKDKNESEVERISLSTKGDDKENDTTKVQKPEGKVGIDAVANLGRSGGVYIPPFKLARMMKDVQDKSSVEYQRMTWDALRKSINGLVNKVNATNIKNIIPELFAENLIRGRGLFCRSCMKSQMASPGFTDVFAALVAVVNTKFPEVGDLLLRRIILQLQRAYKRNDKPQLLAAVKFIAHLVNQQIVHELIALELLTLLLEKPTDDSVEVAVGFVTECGSLLQDLSPRGLHESLFLADTFWVSDSKGIFERFRGILHEGEIDKRVQFLIEGLFALRKAKFQGYPAVRPELDLVEQEDQLTHEVSLLDEIDPEITLDIFKPDPNFSENEKRYEELKKQILGASAISYFQFQMELCIMLLECCSQERTYLRYYGLLGQRFCMINKVHQENFETCFVQQYSMIHRLETNKLRNVAKFFAHLLGTDALPWHVLAYIRLTEEDTTSSSRIFIKILFQELSEHLGIRLLNERLSDPAMQESFESIFPRDNPKNTRFAINFFTSIGLGGITENLREYLKNMPRLIMQQQKAVSESDSESDSSSSDSDGSGSSSSESSASESETDSDDRRRRKRRRN